jgi:hypothetical protein
MVIGHRNYHRNALSGALVASLVCETFSGAQAQCFNLAGPVKVKNFQGPLKFRLGQRNPVNDERLSL